MWSHVRWRRGFPIPVVTRNALAVPEDRIDSRGGGMTVQVVSPEELDAEEGPPGVSRRSCLTPRTPSWFRHSSLGATIRWHTHGDRHGYGYHIEGSSVLEYGPGGDKRVDTEAGGFRYRAGDGTSGRESNRRRCNDTRFVRRRRADRRLRRRATSRVTRESDHLSPGDGPQPASYRGCLQATIHPGPYLWN